MKNTPKVVVGSEIKYYNWLNGINVSEKTQHVKKTKWVGFCVWQIEGKKAFQGGGWTR